MSTSVQNKEIITTPAGSMYWVKITPPGSPAQQGSTEMRYSAQLLLPNNEIVQKLVIDKIHELYQANHNNNTVKKLSLQSLGYKYCDSEGITEPSENLIIPTPEHVTHFMLNFTTKTTYATGQPKTIDVFNSKGNKIDLRGALIANNSTGALSGTMVYYQFGNKDGVSLYLDSIQIIKFIEYTSAPEYEVYKDGFDGIDNFIPEIPEVSEIPAKPATLPKSLA